MQASDDHERILELRKKVIEGDMTANELANMVDYILVNCDNCDHCPIFVADNDYTCGHFIARLLLEVPRDNIAWDKSGMITTTD